MNKVITKKVCDKCGYSFSAKGGNYQKHVKICDGNYAPFEKMKCCKYCFIEFADDSRSSEIANHVRWCDRNPQKATYVKNMTQMRAGITAESRKKQAEGISKAHKEGKYSHINRAKWLTERTHTNESKALMSQKALASKHRRLVRSIREYVKKDGSIVMLDSSWEEALARRLDDLEIDWIRPNDPIEYETKDGKVHNYFPDFFLPDHNLYLDPKNPAAVIAQKEKVEVLLRTMPNLLILKTLEECNKFQC